MAPLLKFAGAAGIGLTVIAMAVSVQLLAPEAPPAALPGAPPDAVALPAADQDAAVELEAAAAAVRPANRGEERLGSQVIEGVKQAELPAAIARPFATSHHAAVQHLAAAARRPHCRPWEPEHFVDLKLATACGLVDARLALAAGHAAAATAAWLDVLAAGWALSQAPHGTLLQLMEGDALVRQALLALAPQQAALLGAPAPVLESLLAELNKLEARRAPAHNLLWGERDQVVAAMRKGEMSDELALDAGLAGLPLAPELLQGEVRAAAPYVKQVFDRRMAMLDRGDRNALEADRLAPDVDPGELQVALLGPRAYFRRVLLSLAAPDGTRSYLHAARTRMALDGLRAGLACELYRRSTGKAPARLADLTPRWLPAVPADPYAPGQALGFTEGAIWSVGPDGKQDGLQAASPWYFDDADPLPPKDLQVFPLVEGQPT